MQKSEFLEGVRVVTMAQNVPGPVATARMRDAGAAVVKIEPPAGDPLQLFAPAWYAELHAGIAVERLNLKSHTGRARAGELLRDSDLFLTSQRPSSLRALGLDRETLHSEYAQLRILRIVGSVADPDRPGHDLTYQARVGLLDDVMPRTLVADLIAAERVFAGALALLRERPGSATDVGIVDSLEPLLDPLRHGLTAAGGPLSGAWATYRLYPAKDGVVAVAALEPHFAAALYRELELPGGSDLSLRMRERSAAEWEAWARDRDLPIVAVRAVGRD